MKKKRTVLGIALTTCIFASSAFAALSASETWSKTAKDFCPNTGTLDISANGQTLTTKIYFKYSSNDISYLEGKYDDGLKAGMDIKNDAYEKERLDAYTITTSLPNPKTDIESDDLDGYNEEADVVALDIPSATNYKMAVYWMDERDGKNSGEFVVNAELSEKGFIDYNTVDYKTCVSYYYGADKGEIPG